MIKYLCISIAILFATCNTPNKTPNPALKKIVDNYWVDYLKLYPLEATAFGVNTYNDKLPNNQTDSFRKAQGLFYDKYLNDLGSLNKNSLSAEDKLTYDLLAYELNISKEKLSLPFYYMPINQFWSFTTEFTQLGSGTGNQPFANKQDYLNFISRIKSFPAWIDSAIANMKLGIANGYVLPKPLVEKIIPQLKDIITIDPTQSTFYLPIKNMSPNVDASFKDTLKNMYFFHIANTLTPAFSKLKRFLEIEYLPASRSTHGYSSLPKGKEMYAYLAKYYTTTSLPTDSIYNLGLNQVALLKAEMEKIKTDVGFTGSLQQFFTYINDNDKFKPFKNAKQVLDSFWSCKKTADPFLKKIFNKVPKTKFEIRQTEAFRAASASAEYNAGSEDGSRPGIFYVPILEANKFNAVGMETLFLHEAIPGHHYQISLQQENIELPQFRKFMGYSAYAEGWALYTETLGKELGLYKDKYQYLGHLSDAMHRAIRLVVDVGIHTKGMTREQAINYMMTNERITEQEATAEIERYMAIPGQALSYMVGKISIMELRNKYQKQLGNKFNLAGFHDAVLGGGNMPLQYLNIKIENWAQQQ
jgi:uncharacterized protein (DUF885 family)